MKHLFMATVGAAAVLVGCGSFNNSFNTYSGYHPDKVARMPEPPAIEKDDDDVKIPPPAVQPAAVEAPVTPTETKCAVNPAYSIPKPPELPIKALQDAGRDIYAIEKIERKHIDELRLYISKVRHNHAAVQLDFTAKCKAVAK